MKIALVHDWLTGMRGGERCLEVFIEMFPEADVFTLLHVPGATSDCIDSRVRGTSFLQKFPGVKRYYRHLLPLYPKAARSIHLEGYDLVISLSHAAAKNVVTPAQTPHVSYCFTPMRYVWDQAESYFGKLTPLLWPILRQLRQWDYQGAAGVDQFIAISRFVAARIRKFYGRDSRVIYPPVDTKFFTPGDSKPGEAFLYAGALVPYKRADIAVKLCSQRGERLWVAGAGPEEARLRAVAGPTVEFLGRVSDEELRDRFRRCRALFFPGKEDFGIIPIECLASGRPVIGLFEGALRESLQGFKHWESDSLAVGECSGVFIKKEMAQDLLEATGRGLDVFLRHEAEFQSGVCRKNAERFSYALFKAAIAESIAEFGVQFARNAANEVEDVKAKAAAI